MEFLFDIILYALLFSIVFGVVLFAVAFLLTLNDMDDDDLK